MHNYHRNRKIYFFFWIIFLLFSVFLPNSSEAQMTVSSPFGGEVWDVGSTKRIQWTQTESCDSFTIQISRDGGLTWSDIESGLPSSYTYRDWTVTPPGSTSCQVKVIGYYAGGSIDDSSDGNFTIGQLTLTSPDGGEIWQNGTTHDITWTSAGVTGNILIQPYLDGEPQVPITTTAQNTGNYPWSIPIAYPSGTTYTIGISALGGLVSDFSYSNFTIEGGLEINAQLGWAIFTPSGPCIDPENGSEYRYGPSIIINDDDSIDVWFSSPGEHIDEVKTEFDWIRYNRSTDGGITWLYDWEDDPSSVVMVPSPGSNDRYSCCDPGVIKFGGYYYIAYTSGSAIGKCNDVFVARSTSPTGPFDKWNGSGWGGDNPQPCIYGDYNELTDWGASEPSFVVKNDTLYIYYEWTERGTLIATAPTNDPNWPANITDHKPPAFAPAIPKVLGEDSRDVKYIDDLGLFVAVAVGNRFSNDSYMHVWKSVDGFSFIEADKILVNIEDQAHNVGISGTCEGHINLNHDNFIGYGYGPHQIDGEPACWSTYWNPVTISASSSAPQVTVISPFGGEVWEVGNAKQIQWTQTGTFDSFTIQISRDGGLTWSDIESGLPGNYTYRDWTVTPPESTSCQIKVIGYYAGGSIDDSSVSNFTIGQLTLTSPDGGEIWQTGSTHDITWFSAGVFGNILIQPYLDGEPQAPITTTAQNTGNYPWSIPIDYPSGTTYTIGISALGGLISDFSYSNFTIEEDVPLGPVLNITPLNRDLPFTAGTTTFQVENTGMPDTLNWTALTSTPWLTITDGFSGLDSGMITVEYEANSGGSRTGILTVIAPDATGSPAMVTIYQEEDFTSTAVPLPSYDLPFTNEYAGENICYTLDLTRCQGISIALNAHLASGYLGCGLYDSLGNRLVYCINDQIEDGEYGYLNFNPTLTGTYYLRVFGSPDAVGTFDLVVYDAWFNAGVTDGDRDFFATLYTARFLGNDIFLLGPHDSDFFRFAAQSGDQIAVSLLPHISQGTLDINLLDRSGNLLAACEDIYDAAVAVISRTITLDGNYYIKIDRNNGAVGNYDLATNPDMIINGDNEGDGLSDAAEYHYGTALNAADTDGDGVSDYSEVAQGSDPLHNYPVVVADNAVSMATAVAVPALDVPFTAELPADVAASYYAMNLAAGQEIAVSLSPRINVGNLDLSLLDHAGATIAAVDDIYGAADCVVTGTNQLQRGVITGTITLDGDYYIKIDRDDGAYGNVDLAVYNGWENPGTTDCDRNFYSTRNTARFLYGGNYPLSWYDSDFFRFTAESGDQVFFSLTPYINVGSLDISLLDQYGNIITASEEVYGDTIAITRTVIISDTITLEGDYYVKINRHDNAYGNYDLLTAGINSDSDADGMADAWEMYYFCHLGRDGYGDWDDDGLSDKDEYDLSTNPRCGDTDGDLMPDAWEVLHGLDPLEDDAGDDQDFDMLSNYGEYDNNCDPTNPDTDHDQMIDGWEVMNDLNPLVDDVLEDPDQDGHSNLGEFLSGSNPLDKQDIPPLKADFNYDLDADGLDLIDIILDVAAGDCAPGVFCAADLDGDGDVDDVDLMLFAEDFGRVESSCTADDLSSCMTENQCKSSGFYWYDGGYGIPACYSEPKCRLDNLAGCETEVECAALGAYWYDETCNAEPACMYFADCDTSERCINSGFYWYDGSCHEEPDPVCSPDNLAGCVTEADCVDNGGEWHNYTTSGAINCTAKTTTTSSTNTGSIN